MPRFQAFYDVVDRRTVEIEAENFTEAGKKLRKMWEEDSQPLHAGELTTSALENVDFQLLP